MSKTPKETLKALMNDGSMRITGFELNQVVESILSGGDDSSEEYVVAEQLYDDYFADSDAVYKPAKFAFYGLVFNNDASYSCRRDHKLSPRGVEYFVPNNSASDEYDVRDTLRTVITNKQHIKGCDLKELIDQTLSHEKAEETEAFTNFSEQLASYTQQYFLQDGNVRDDVWYTLRTKEYGTLVVLRDLKRSPRAAQSKPQKKGKK